MKMIHQEQKHYLLYFIPNHTPNTGLPQTQEVHNAYQVIDPNYTKGVVMYDIECGTKLYEKTFECIRDVFQIEKDTQEHFSDETVQYYIHGYHIEKVIAQLNKWYHYTDYTESTSLFRSSTINYLDLVGRFNSGTILTAEERFDCNAKVMYAILINDLFPDSREQTALRVAKRLVFNT